MAGCASVPNVNSYIDGSSPAGGEPVVVGARGPLSPEQSAAILARLEAQSKSGDLLARHVAIEQALAGSPLVAGNRTRVLRDGTATFRAMFAAIRGARQFVNLEYYIFEEIESDGQRLSDLLVAKRKAGVAVYVIYDSFGSLATPAAFFQKLKAAGVRLLEYHPVNPVDALAQGYSINDRDHRKILIADGTLAIVGGVNMSSAYESHPLSKLAGSRGKPPEKWRDTDLEIEGPAVARLQALFLEQWRSQQGASLDEPARAKIPPMGQELVRVIGSEAIDTIPRYYATLLSAIRNAERTIWLTTGYFVPTDEELEDLRRAARRGVDVRLLLPGRSDSERALAVGRSHYGDLLEAGVKIYETRDEILHSKTVVIDGVWSVVGSSNFDHRSVLFNDEVDAVVLGRETARQLEAIFRDESGHAKQIDLASWEDRPLTEKLNETFSSIWQNLL